MTAPFPEEQAYKACLEMIEELKNGSLELKQISAVSEERGDHGVMLGAALCHDESGHLFILKAVSGISKELVRIKPLGNNNLSVKNDFSGGEGFSVKNQISEIFVPPIVDPEKINEALFKNDREIHVLTEKIKEMKAARKRPDGKCNDQSPEEKLLCERRQHLCNESLLAVYRLYSFCCADGKKRSLLEICGLDLQNEKGLHLGSQLEESETDLQNGDSLVERETVLQNGGRLPPTGTGDCCAPKLLDYAFSHNLLPFSMAEVFYGRDTKNKINGKCYEPCDERCGLILPTMLGIKILYRDKDIIVVEKPGGLLSVPGRGEEKLDCVVNRVKRLFPDCIKQPSVHRLDMETSGLLVLAFTEKAHDELCRQFEEKTVEKKYKALLDGDIFKSKGMSAPNGEGFENFDAARDNPKPLSKEEAKNVLNYREPEPKEPQMPSCFVNEDKSGGEMKLYFRVDLLNRPHQVWDTCYGKESVTKWRLDKSFSGKIRRLERGRIVTPVEFIPLTGRTHQLRLASADIHGLGLPILGDSLYCVDPQEHCRQSEEWGKKPLMLHACYLSFIHPVTGKRMEFTSIPWWEKINH